MLLLLRRYLALAALFFWQGGFTFYASVVVPVGQQVFGHLRQGFVTRQVTVYLNFAGAAALTLLLWDLIATRDASAWRRRGRRLLWLGMALTLVSLFWLHGQLDELLVHKGRIILDEDEFHPRHRLYLWISTLQWGCALLYLFLALSSWRQEDHPADEGSAEMAARTSTSRQE
jgi:hypothetical protein